MSAYIVDRDHIVYLVEAGVHRGITRNISLYWTGTKGGTPDIKRLRYGDYDRMAEIASTLWRENVRSVSYRYPGEGADTLPGPVGEDYEITTDDFGTLRAGWSFEPVQVLKAIDCYIYQSCEHPEFYDSEAYDYCRALRSAAIHALPGYDDASWGAPKKSR